jgi:hypothetical protein
MFRAILRVPVAGALVATAAAGAAADESARLRFAAGADRAEIAARLVGDEGRNVIVGARAGQSMIVEMTTSNASAHFNVRPPGADAAMFVGSTAGRRFEGVLPADGDYRIQAYLMRNAARRGETADIRLSVTIPAAGASAAPAPDFADGLAGGPDFWEVHGVGAGDRLNLRAGPSTGERVLGRVTDGAILRNHGCAMTGSERWRQVRAEDLGVTAWAAGRFLREGAPPADAATGPASEATGTIPCAKNRGEPSAPCAFTARRSRPGDARVTVAFAGGGERTIVFVAGRPASADAPGALTVTQEDDLRFVRIGDERFEIPAAVADGG